MTIVIVDNIMENTTEETPFEQTNVTASEKQPFNGLDSPFLASEIVLGLVPNCISYLYIKNDLKVHQHIRRLLLFGSIGNCIGLGKKFAKDAYYNSLMLGI